MTFAADPQRKQDLPINGKTKPTGLTVVLKASRLARLLTGTYPRIVLVAPDAAERLSWQNHFRQAGGGVIAIDPLERNAPIGAAKALWITSGERCIRDADLMRRWAARNTHIDLRVGLHGPFESEDADLMIQALEGVGVPAAEAAAQFRRLGVIGVRRTSRAVRMAGRRAAVAGALFGGTATSLCAFRRSRPLIPIDAGRVFRRMSAT